MQELFLEKRKCVLIREVYSSQGWFLERGSSV